MRARTAAAWSRPRRRAPVVEPAKAVALLQVRLYLLGVLKISKVLLTQLHLLCGTV
jgi:hypothetical protein